MNYIKYLLNLKFKGKKIFPFLKWLPELKNREVLNADIYAGISVAIVLIPQSIAYAELAGLPAEMGLYASFIPTIIAGFFGSSRQTSTGPVAVVSLLTAASLGNIASSGTEGYYIYATLMAFMVGLFQLILGITRMGIIVNFLSHPVIRGFTNAAAIIIITSQIPKILGINLLEKGDYFYETVYDIVLHIKDFDILTFLIGSLSILFLFYIKRFKPKYHGTIIVIIFTTFISWLIGFDGVIGNIPNELPGISLPDFNVGIILEIITSSIIIGLIGFMEAISIAKTMAIKNENIIDINQELIGQGLSNLSSGLFGGYPVAGSFSRSAIANNLNAKTGFYSVISGLVVGLTILFLTPIIYFIPKVTLSIIIVVAVSSLIDFSPLKKAWKVNKSDFIVGIITFSSTLLLAPNLEKGILIGVLLSLSLFLYSSMKPRFIELSMYKDGSLRDSERFSIQTSKNIGVYRFDGSLYFANAEYFSERLFKFIDLKPDIKLIILDFEGLDTIDITGLNTLEKTIKMIKNKEIVIYILKAKLQIKKTFEDSDFFLIIPEEHFFNNMTYALKYSSLSMLGLDKHSLKKYKPKK